MLRIRSWFFACLGAFALASGHAAQAQDAPEAPLVSARLFIDNAHPENGNRWAAVVFTIPDHWHIYWQNPGDSGIPTALDWKSLPDGVSAGPIHWPVPKRAETGGLVNYGYEKQVLLPVPLKVEDNAATDGAVVVKADWLVCKDTCIPESAMLSARLSDTASKADVSALHATLEQVPTAFDGEAFVVADDAKVRVALHTEANSHADIFPLTDGWFPNSATPQVVRAKGWIGFSMPRGSASLSDRFEGVASVTHEGITEHVQFTAPRVEAFPAQVPPTLFPAETVPQASAPLGLLTALVFAFIGGLILNLMPCVLPVLSLKVLSLSRKAEASRGDALKHGLAYTAGVLASFALIGAALLALKAGGTAIGWGFQLQSPAFVLALVIIVFLVALNLLGLFELPVLFGGKGQAIASKNTATGSFATGVLAVALATPCTAPFMAPALGAALTLPALASMLVFLVLGLGLAAPYLLVSISPALRRLLPKPGAWMQRFKEFLAFPMFATTAWLVWVLGEQTGGIGLMQAFALLIALALALWGLKRNHHALWRAFWKVLLIGSIACALVNPPQLRAGSFIHENAAFDAAEIARLRSAKTPVFVDATAAWCLTCKLNERVALKNSRIVSLFKERNITFMVADWTKRDEAITAWLTSFGRNGVPLYVYYPPGKEPVVLPQLLTPALVEDAIRAADSN